MGAVEAEGPRLELTQADVAVNACELLREDSLFTGGVRHEHSAISHLECAFHRVGQPTGVRACADHETVDYDLDGMPLLTVQVEGLGQVVYIAIYTDADVPGTASLLEHVFVLALPAPHHRRQDLDSSSFRRRQDGVHNLLHRLHLHEAAALITVRPAHSGKQ